MPNHRDPSEDIQKIRERLSHLEADRKWLLFMGLVFAALLGVTNLVSVPAAAEKQAKIAAQAEVAARMPDVVGKKLGEYIEKRSGIDFVAAARQYAAEAEDANSRAQVAAKRTREVRGTAEEELERMLGLQRGCILADSCPQGWNPMGTVGIIWNRTTGVTPFQRGSDYNNGWDWVHPSLCCKS